MLKTLDSATETEVLQDGRGSAKKGYSLTDRCVRLLTWYQQTYSTYYSNASSSSRYTQAIFHGDLNAQQAIGEAVDAFSTLITDIG